MSNLKILINDFVEEQFSNLSDNKKSLIKSLSLKKTLSQPYYKDTYYTSSVAIKKNGSAAPATNAYNLDDGEYFEVMHNLSDNELDYTDFDKAKKFLVDPSVASRLNIFISMAKQSDTLESFAQAITEAQRGDPEFLSTLRSFKYILPEYDKLFFTESVNQILSNNGIDEYIKSSLCKNDVFIAASDFNNDTSDLMKWESKKPERDAALSKYLSLFENINEHYQKYAIEMSQVEQHIKNNKPHLFSVPLSDNVSFSYFQTLGRDYNDAKHSFALQPDLDIDKAILEKHGITISEVYDIKPKEYKYGPESLQEAFLRHMLKKDDDISNKLPSRFYGLDFLNDSALQSFSDGISYIIAKSDDDIVGLLSFNSSDREGHSVIKNIGYVCVKDNFRGTGLAEKLYDKLASICVDNGNIIVNSHYTDQGRDKLPRLKQRIREKHPEFFMLDTDLGAYKKVGSNQYQIMQTTKGFNELLRSYLLERQKYNPEGLRNNIKEIIAIHKDAMTYINDNKESFCHDDFFVLSDARNELYRSYKKRLMDLLEPQELRKSHKP